MLKPIIIPEPGIKAGKFGKSGKMIIKPYSIPDEYKELYKKILIKNVKICICGCWEWQGRIHNGYAVCPTPYVHDGNSRWGHRVSYAVFNGDIKAQMHIDHTCRNKKCIRPDHLKQVTPQQNYEAIQRRRLRDEKKLKEEMGQLILW